MFRKCTKAGNVKGQVLVSLRLLLDNNPVFIAACCNEIIEFIVTLVPANKCKY